MSRGNDASTLVRPQGAPARKRSPRRLTPRDRPMPRECPPAQPGAWALGLSYAAAIVGGSAFSLAWLMTETAASAVLGWVSAALLVLSVRTHRAFGPAYLCGLVVYGVSFYWMYTTIAAFGGFGPIISGAIFALYVLSGAVFFVVFAWVHHNLGRRFDAFALRSPVAIVVAELITVRLFYWHFGHTQVAFTPFVQIAGVGGAMLVSFVMFWLVEVGVRVLAFREWRPTFLLPLAAFAVSLGYGLLMMSALRSPGGETQEIVLVQGPPELSEKRDMDSIWLNLARLYELSRESARKAALIVWPEGTIAAYIRADLGSVQKEPDLPWLHNGSAFLVGAFATDASQNRYNAAFAVYPDGTVPTPYFKQVLIPFGEYMPFASVFPSLNRLNENAGLFTAGREIRVFDYPMQRADGRHYTARVAPVICYEDTIPSPARAATLRGAELLVNLTYDTWFGRTAAPFQHHLIAMFRAIENRRYLVRSTYSGYTAVVSPLGKTIARIPAFQEGKIALDVPLLKYQSSYTHYVGDYPCWGLCALSIGTIALGRWQRRRGG